MFFQMMDLLERWPLLPVERALELLDYAYADQEVRKFAVRCLLDIRCRIIIKVLFLCLV